MRKLILSTLFMFGMLASYAYDYPYMMFRTADDVYTPISVESLVFTFSGGQLIATSADGELTYNLSELKSMYFAETETSATEVQEDTDESIIVYGLSGVCYGEYETLADVLPKLTQGIYIIKSASKTYKIAVK